MHIGAEIAHIWIVTALLKSGLMHIPKDGSSAQSPADLAAVFPHETIVTIPADTDKSAVLTKLVKSLVHAGWLPEESVDEVIKALQERERYGTTGLGKGLALPHLRCREMTDFVGAIGIAPTGVDFDSLDGQPTRLIILLLSPFDQRAKHLEIMGRLARLLSNKTLQYSVQQSRSPEVLFQFLGF
jgi:nitrogen PTS system EIIA component